MRMRKKPWARPELEACEFFIQQPTSKKGCWKQYFKNQAPIYLELGCGKGSFIAQMASKNRNINFIAVDIKDEMLAYARRKLESAYEGEQIENVALLPYDIERIWDVFAQEDTIDRIYINFCNPWPKPRHRKKRLTHTRQLEKYKLFLKQDGEIHFKTDDDALYKDTLCYLKEAGFQIVENITDLAKQDDKENIITEHEKMFMEQGICIKKIVGRNEKTYVPDGTK